MFWAHCWSHFGTKAPPLLTPHLPPELLPRYPYHMSWWRQGSCLIYWFLGIYQFLPCFNPLVGPWEFLPLVEWFITASPWVTFFNRPTGISLSYPMLKDRKNIQNWHKPHHLPFTSPSLNAHSLSPPSCIYVDPDLIIESVITSAQLWVVTVVWALLRLIDPAWKWARLTINVNKTWKCKALVQVAGIFEVTELPGKIDAELIHF